MKVKKAFYVSTDDSGVRPYEKGEIIGLKWVTEDGGANWYLNYVVLYKDGFMLLVSGEEADKYDLV
jgi:hypothetical protein